MRQKLITFDSRMWQHTTFQLILISTWLNFTHKTWWPFIRIISNFGFDGSFFFCFSSPSRSVHLCIYTGACFYVIHPSTKQIGGNVKQITKNVVKFRIVCEIYKRRNAWNVREMQKILHKKDFKYFIQVKKWMYQSQLSVLRFVWLTTFFIQAVLAHSSHIRVTSCSQVVRN